MIDARIQSPVPRLLFWLGLAVLLATGSAWAETPATPAAARVVRVGYFDYRPGVFRNEQGGATGFYPELLALVAEERGWRLEYVYCSWSEGLERVRRGEVDLITSVAFTEERAGYLDYCRQPLLTVWGELYLREDSPVRSIGGASGLRVAVMRGDFNAASFRHLAEQMGLRCEYLEVDGFEAAFAAVRGGAADAAVANSVFGTARHHEFGLRPTGTVFAPFDIFFAVAKGRNGDLRDALDEALERWRGDSASPYFQARLRWLQTGATVVPVVPRWVVRALVVLAAVLVGAAGFIVLLRSQVRRHTESLRAERERYRGLVENIHDLVLEVDEAGVVRYASPPQLRRLGHEPERVLGLGVDELVHPEDRGRWRTESSPVRLRVRDGAGAWRQLECAVRVLPDGATRIVTARDVTEQVHAEEARGRLEAQLRQSQKLEAIGTLAGGIAHDFNNMLTGILGNAELLLMTFPADHPQVAPVRGIRQAGLRAKALVARILTFSRRGDLQRQLTSVTPVLIETVELLRSTLPPNVVLQPELPARGDTVLCDPSQIQQVIMNLGTNAAQAMKRSGGVVRVAESTVELDAEFCRVHPRLRPGRHVRLLVQDTGCGMSAEVQARIFEPFFTTKPPGEGTGLGLSVVHGIVESHEGAIRVLSREGAGTTVEVYLPVAAQPEAGAAGAELLPRGDGELILVVDDEAVIREMLAGLLPRLGYRVELCRNVEAAWEKLLDAPWRFGAVLCDFNMPGADGLELGARMRAQGQQTPFILMSGFLGEAEERRVRSLGGARFVEKPLESGALARALAAALAPGGG